MSRKFIAFTYNPDETVFDFSQEYLIRQASQKIAAIFLESGISVPVPFNWHENVKWSMKYDTHEQLTELKFILTYKFDYEVDHDDPTA